MKNAMRLARQGVRERADFVGAHRVLTAAAGMAGRAEVATVALQELRRVQPNISLAWIASQMPIKLDAEREHYLEGLRRAGLDYLRPPAMWTAQCASIRDIPTFSDPPGLFPR
jgi:hypothetical protein